MKLQQKSLNRFVFNFLVLFLVSCSVESNDRKKIMSLAESDPHEALVKIDKKISKSKTREKKLYFVEIAEKIITKKMRKADLLRDLLIKKSILLKDKAKQRSNYLILSQLLIQNLNDDVTALHYLNKISVDELAGKEREQFFHFNVLANLNLKNSEQALIELEDYLSRKDLSPSETFKLKVLKARTVTSLKNYEQAESIYINLLEKSPNLSKKWNIRSQLALTFEDQKKYAQALKQLKILYKEGDQKDELLAMRIKELADRHIQQPGAKGRLRK